MVPSTFSVKVKPAEGADREVHGDMYIWDENGKSYMVIATEKTRIDCRNGTIQKRDVLNGAVQ